MRLHAHIYTNICNTYLHTHVDGYIPKHMHVGIHMYMHTYLCKQICTHMNAYTCIYKICPHNHPNIYIQINIQAYTYMDTQLFLNFWFGAKSSRLLTYSPPSTINKKTCRFNTENSSCAEVHNLVCTMDLPAAFCKV